MLAKTKVRWGPFGIAKGTSLWTDKHICLGYLPENGNL
jgi:hypothetical protein